MDISAATFEEAKDTVFDTINTEFKKLKEKLQEDSIDDQITFISAIIQGLNRKANSVLSNSFVVGGMQPEAQKEVAGIMMKLTAASTLHATLLVMELKEKELNNAKEQK